eukprot:12788381-Heterocapsa_arctica.AAC.1
MTDASAGAPETYLLLEDTVRFLEVNLVVCSLNDGRRVHGSRDYLSMVPTDTTRILGPSCSVLRSSACVSSLFGHELHRVDSSLMSAM